MNSPQPSVPASPSGFSGAALVEWQRSQQSDQPQRCMATRRCDFHNSLCVVDTCNNRHSEMSRRLATSGRSAHVCPSGTCAGISSIVFAAACQQQIIKTGLKGGNICADVVTEELQFEFVASPTGYNLLIICYVATTRCQETKLHTSGR